jgi:hypothetical protein
MVIQWVEQAIARIRNERAITAMNPIQFQPGTSLFEPFEHYGTEP